MSDYITKEEAAKIMGVSLRTVDNLMHAREIPFYKVGRAVRFKKSDIERFEAQRTTRFPANWE